MAYSGDGAPAAQNNRQSTPPTSQNAARDGAARRACSTAGGVPGRRCRSALPLAGPRPVLVSDRTIAGSSWSHVADAAEVEPRSVRKIKGILPNGSWFHAPATGTGLALGALGRGGDLPPL